ncbi:hypothetical protein [Ramlibacter humi]|uniref:Uncharacterized protein n=1 Tax=Ramlibacter humi TaxID=2530451 RepID=A0A4Z0CDR8_9BURK|nr:hypothetical protein [Ramlibacter humi]TFZ08640.1 hypothetical protein EZ216_05650 [Ramlibacter humi]
MKFHHKRTLVVLATAICLAAPAHAFGPLAGILINYAKQALKEKLISYAKGKAREAIAGALGDVPGAGALGAIAPGLLGGMAPRPTLSKEAQAALETAGVFDKNAKPPTEEEWKEFEQTMARMATAGGPDAEMPDLAAMRANLKEHPELAGMVRALFGQMHAIRTEQERMAQLYEQMPEDQRQEVVAELVKTVREAPAADQPQMKLVLESDALGWPEDLKERVLAASK